MTAKTIAMIIILLYNVRICQSKRYDNYTLFFTTPTRPEQVKFLKNLQLQKYINVIFWKKPNLLYEEVHCLVSPEDRSLFLQRARHFDLKIHEKITDIQRAFDSQHIKKYLRSEVGGYSWKYYHSLDDIYQWLTDIALQHPNKTRLISIGKSAEGREIYAISVRQTPGPKHKVIVEGGIHGNEWVAVEFVTYLLNVLVRERDTHSRLRALSEKYDWYLVPIVNPDGYDYTQREDRLWRKNRRVIKKDAIGVDINRNFDYNWGKFGSSKDPQDDYYCGNQPFSEPESRALRNFISSKRINLRFYFAIHSYGQQLIIPYSDRINHIDNFSEMENYGKQAVMSMYKLNGRKYGTGTSYDTLGQQISGNSESWVKKTHAVRYVFTLLLRDHGTYGYALPSSQIEPACEEIITGLTELMVAKPRRVKLDLFSNSSAKELRKAIYMLFCVVYVILLIQ